MIVGGYTYYPANNIDYGNLFYRTNSKGDTIFKCLFKIPSNLDNMLVGHGLYDIYISSKYDFTGYNLKADSGNIKLLRFTCDSNGKNSKIQYNTYHVAALDSMTTTHAGVLIKYMPEKCFYVYGVSPYAPKNSYIIWKLDTSGKMLWRQDYYDTINSNNFTLTVLKDKMLLTSEFTGNRGYGERLVWLDTMGNVLKENSLSDAWISQKAAWQPSKPLVLPDTSVIIGFSGSYSGGGFAWPLIVKLDKNLNTVWARNIKIQRDPTKIDPKDDYTQIRKITWTADSTIAVWWGKSFVDYTDYNQGYYGSGDVLTQMHPDGSIIPSKHPDSTDYWGKVYRKGVLYDIVPTQDKGFAFAGTNGHPPYYKTKNTYLLKLRNKVITGVEKPEVENLHESISLYPNPSIASITIKTEENFNDASIKIFNTQGQEILSYSHINGNEYTIDTEILKEGLYILKLTNNTTIHTLKFAHTVN